MRHLVTKNGTFWIASASHFSGQYFLGIDDFELGLYSSEDQALKDILSQKTGHLKWDMQVKFSIPAALEDWKKGEPTCWH